MVELIEEGKKSTEDEVCGSIFASKVPPAFNDSFVIAVSLKVSARASNPGDSPDEELETYGFSPSDVSRSVECLPAWDEMPCSPSVLDGDGNAEARTCIGEGM